MLVNVLKINIGIFRKFSRKQINIEKLLVIIPNKQNAVAIILNIILR